MAKNVKENYLHNLNYTKNGFKSIIKKLRRKSKNFEEGNYKEQIMAVHKRWADVEYWKAIKKDVHQHILVKNILKVWICLKMKMVK